MRFKARRVLPQDADIAARLVDGFNAVVGRHRTISLDLGVDTGFGRGTLDRDDTSPSIRPATIPATGA